MYDIFDYGTLIMLNVVAIANIKVLEMAQKKSKTLILLCFLSWLMCFVVFMLEMNFSSLRNYNTIRRLSADANAYTLSFFILGMTVFVDFMIRRY